MPTEKTKTYTAVRNGYFFVRRGTWEQVQKVLELGYCVCRAYGPDRDGDVVISLGILIKGESK